MATVDKLFGSMRADKTISTGNKDFFILHGHE